MAIIISGFCFSRILICFLSDIPPMIHTELNFFVFNICKCLSIYNASSLVGDNIKAYGIPFFSTLTTIGSKKHKVLPLPVFDAMIKSYRWLTPAGIAYR